MNYINPIYIDHYKADLKRDSFNHDPIEFRLGLLDCLQDLINDYSSPLYKKIIGDDDIEHGYHPGSFIYLNQVYFVIQEWFYKSASEQDKKEFCGDYYMKLREKTGYVLQFIWTHPAFRGNGVGGSIVQWLMKLIKDVNSYLVVVPRPSFEAEFSPAFVNHYQQFEAIASQPEELFFYDLKCTQKGVDQLYKFYQRLGFTHKLPELKKPDSGFKKGPLLFLP